MAGRPLPYLARTGGVFYVRRSSANLRYWEAVDARGQLVPGVDAPTRAGAVEQLRTLDRQGVLSGECVAVTVLVPCDIATRLAVAAWAADDRTAPAADDDGLADFAQTAVDNLIENTHEWLREQPQEA